MAIKPKSRAHEDRIKALENCEKAQREVNENTAVDLMDVFMRLHKLEHCRPWYKRIFGL